MREEFREFENEKEERHQKRLQRLQANSKGKNGGGDSRNGNGNGSLRPQSRRLQSSSSPDLRYGGSGGPTRYIDDNPYNSGGPTAPGYGYDSRR